MTATDEPGSSPPTAGPEAGSKAVWMIRAGGKGEAEQLCLQQGLCGIGWPDLPDLSVLGDEGVEHEIDAVYGEEPTGKVRNTKMQIRHFRSMAIGDVVLMPLKTKPDQVAIGRIVGPYEYRPELSELTHHVRPTDWISDGVPKALFQSISSSLNRPLTISPTPATPEQVEHVLDSGEPLPAVAGAGSRKLADLLQQVLHELEPNADRAALSKAISASIPTALGELLPEERAINHGLGMGAPADVPWVGIGARGVTGNGHQGVFAVYLFATDGSAVFLSLNQGTEEVRGGLNPLVKRARDIRSVAAIDSPGEAVDLKKKGGRPAKYQAASAFAIRYDVDAVPDDGELLTDLEEVLSTLDLAAESGLVLDPEIEPIHLVFKWSADIEAQTVSLHRQVAEARGSVWWGKFGTSASAIGARRLDQINEQLKAGIPTSVFLYGGGELVRTKLEEITIDASAVDETLLPGYYEKGECNLFVRLADFEPLPANWLLDHVVLAKNPSLSADEMAKALGNQTTPLFVFELFAPGGTEAGVSPSLDMPWLIGTTLWKEEELTEILNALEDRGQVILAGPPGTGKTWIADHLARYMTGDQPLQTRTVQLHPSYGYEEFVEGLRPVATDKGAISFKLVSGVILEMAEEMEDSDEIRVLVIDELNRANIPRVFGELLFLLEYRDKSIDLQFSRNFSLPKNLKIIATMNTADRSTRSIDIALRRRFEIFECPPRADILGGYYDGSSHSTTVAGLVEGFEKFNADLAGHLDRHHTVGQSFFMGDVFTPESLRRTWRRQILPLLEDYFFDQEDLVEQFKREKYWPGS